MKYIPLVQVCDFQGGSQPPKDQWIDHEKEGYIRMLQIRDFTQPDKDNVEFVRISKTIKTCNEDDILIGRYGASVGKILTGLAGAYNVAIIKTIPDTSKLSKRFLYHYLNSPYFQSFILSVGSRAAQAGFNKDDLSDAQIPDLSLEDQSNIVSQLDKVSGLISLRKEQLVKLDRLVQSRFIELFENKDFPNVLFEDVCVFLRNGANIKQTKGAGGYPITRIETLSNDVFNCDRLGYADITDLSKYENYLLERGDLLISHINSVAYLGRTVQYKGQMATPVIHGMNLLCCRVSSQFNPTYVEWFMRTPMAKDYISSITKKAVNQASMTTSDLKKMTLPKPSIELQEQFAAFVEQTDKSKLAIQQSLDKLELLKKSLMQEYFG